MITHTNDGGPAFPCKYNPCGLDTSMHKPELSPRQCRGMSLRAWFAGMALQGECACETEQFHYKNNAELASACVRKADALIAELEKGTE